MSQPNSRCITMITAKGFDETFSNEMQFHATQEEAFNKLNAEYEKAFGYKRYSNFQSYRVARSKRFSEKK